MTRLHETIVVEERLIAGINVLSLLYRNLTEYASAHPGRMYRAKRSEIWRL